MRPILPFVAGTDTSPGIEVADAPPPGEWFDRQWGVAVLDRARTALASEHAQQGKAEHFQQLKPWLTASSVRLEKFLRNLSREMPQ